MAGIPPPEPVLRGHLLGRLLSFFLIGILLLAGLAFGAVKWLDSDSGRAFIVRQLPRIEVEIGLTLRASRIDGSIFGKAVVHDLEIGDPKGTFAVVPELAFDWRPLDFLTNQLTIHSLTAGEVRVLRRPALLPSSSPTFFPDFDIVIGKLKIDRLILEPPVAGARHVLGVGGTVDIRESRAKVDLVAQTLDTPGKKGSGDTIRVKLDTNPDANIFDMDAVIAAPAGGAIAGLLGLQQPLDMVLRGDGSWQVWQGALKATLGGAPLADFAITAKSGLFSLNGEAKPAALLTGVPARLLGPVLKVDASAKLVEGTALVNARLNSAALAVDAHGGLDFGDERISDAVINARLLDPAAIGPAFRARDAKATARIAGSFADPLVDYRLTATTLGWGDRLAFDLRAAGIIRGGARPLVIPVTLTAARMTGIGAAADPLLTNLRVDGAFSLANGTLTSNAVQFRSDRMNGTAKVSATLATGQYLATVTAALPRFAAPGLGVADLGATLRIASEGSGARITGPVSARFIRLDNAGLNALTQGPPAITANIDIAPDLSVTVNDARLTSPGLTFTANGSLSANGAIRINGAGQSSNYGPVRVAVTGTTTAPVIDLNLASPGVGIGLVDVQARVTGAASAWNFTASAGSDYGPIALAGRAQTGPGPLTLTIDKASLAGLSGHGSIQQTATGPFAGRLDLDGPGLDGQLLLSAEADVQRLDVRITANAARLALAEPVTIESGLITLTARLPRGGTATASGAFDLKGVERGTLRIANSEGTLRYANGHGSARLKANGNGAVKFSIAATAELEPDRIEFLGNGSIDGKPVTMSGPAIITRNQPGTTPRNRPGWSLAPFSIITPEGKAEISGSFGDNNALRAKFDRVSLGLLSIAYPSLGLDGRLSGTIDIMVPAGGVPTGTASLRVNGLTRTGLTAASTPIDIGLNAALNPSGAVAKAVIVRAGKVEGRAQARVGPIPLGTAPLGQRLLASPVFAQFRYNGPAQALWGLAGPEAIDVRGPLSIVADVNGTVGDPKLVGSLRSAGARVESAAIGAVFDQVALDARFANSRLEILRFAGRAGPAGSITGTGGVDLSAERGFPADIRLVLKNAKLADRDDFTGVATGNVRIATDEYGGVISGKLNIDRATYRIGRSNTVTVPSLVVTEKNTNVLGRPTVIYLPPTRWLLNMEIKADRRLFVSGMGLEAEWRADVKVKGGATTPEITGRVDLVRGDYDFAGKRFNLTRGSIRFQGVFPPDPQIDISATSSQNGFTAQIDITGTAQRPEIRFSSVPALPEDEVLSRVLFGESVSNLSAPEALQLAAALNSLRGGGGFNPINAVRKGLGIDRLRILPGDQTRGRGTTFAAGQYIGRNVYVELATDAQGFTATNIEVSLTQSLSILSSIETLGGTSFNVRWKRDY
jgi:translocation and assembly module TamB